jgi:hypothetical protein
LTGLSAFWLELFFKFAGRGLSVSNKNIAEPPNLEVESASCNQDEKKPFGM